MASKLRQRKAVDYRRLNDGQDLPKVQNKTVSIRRTRELLPETFLVDRIINKRRTNEGPEYLVQWSGYSLTECSWEPENNLPRYLVDNFYQPPVDESRVKVFSRHFEDAIQRRLCSRNNKVVIQFDCDVYRYMFGDNESGIFFQEHFSKLFLTDSWCKFLRPSGTGKQITFPIRLQSKLRLRKVFIKNDEGKLEARHYPCEKLIILAGVESYSM